jgi:hypothetical protein
MSSGNFRSSHAEQHVTPIALAAFSLVIRGCRHSHEAWREQQATCFVWYPETGDRDDNRIEAV